MKKTTVCFTPVEVFEWIEQAGLPQLQEVMDVIQERYAILCPDWDILYLALPQQDLNQRMALLKKALDDIQFVR